MKNTFQNKSVIITGGGSGIGKETAHAFLEAGAKVMINGRREDVLQNTVNALDVTGTKMAYVAGDISKKQTSERLINQTVEQFGGVDILVISPEINEVLE